MRILIDSNIVISAFLNPKGVPYQAYLKAVTFPNRGVLTEQNIQEIKRVFQRKFPSKCELLEQSLEIALCAIDIIQIPQKKTNKELLIRDETDQPIIRAAIESKVDILLTGDKDFLESNIKNPIIMSASEFLNI